MANYQKAGICQFVAKIISNLPEFSMFRKMLDLGGVFVSLSGGLTHEGTKPRDMALGMVPTALMCLDMGLNQGYIADSMLRCGFCSVPSQTIDIITGPRELDIRRK